MSDECQSYLLDCVCKPGPHLCFEMAEMTNITGQRLPNMQTGSLDKLPQEIKLQNFNIFYQLFELLLISLELWRGLSQRENIVISF